MAKRKRKEVPTRPAHPYNWGQCLTLAALWLLARLPWRLGLRLGEALGRPGYALASERREVARRNLELCFPRMDSREREALVRQNFRASGRAVVETALAWYGGRQVDAIPIEVRGEEHLRAAQSGGRAVILMSGHFLCVELAARLLPDRIPMAVIYKPMRKKPVLDQAMLNARRRNLKDALPREDIRGLVRTLKSGLPIWYAGDQDYGRKHSVFAPFFGTPAATITALSRLSRMGKAAVVPLFFFRREDGGYLIEFQPELKGFPSGDDLEDATHMNRVLEQAVERYPEQYLWIHRRFKRQEDKKENLYLR
ncbi:MAG: LpxL/LpxP family Kdo(2)-lipid IV(A) lauroyl/palmitoleoyl acyltransferase [Ectothiorhodospiraceae bacterium]|nr:LpxL/LpxP family Kdo(2)-lipid IV(A) lauroyl/palmitoleoyl acyltransferase [Ectothiorhodospiraceae bacterium]MCH8503370.1 LpxL/LpxP family Kdo(2)-lipid IV(A) lauroyl/palmitoleoyl acyltransferase [Ectothiorhodospiraceae bacterium]